MILTGRGDDAGGGVLLDTAKCGRTLLWPREVWWLLQDMEPRPMSGPMLKSWAPKEESAPG